MIRLGTRAINHSDESDLTIYCFNNCQNAKVLPPSTTSSMGAFVNARFNNYQNTKVLPPVSDALAQRVGMNSQAVVWPPSKHGKGQAEGLIGFCLQSNTGAGLVSPARACLSAPECLQVK